MTAINANTVEKNVAVAKRAAGYNERRSTDKYWNLLPIILLIIWAIAARNILIELYHNDTPNRRFNFQDNTVQDSSDYIDIDSELSKAEGSVDHPKNHETDSSDNEVEGSGEYFASGRRKMISEREWIRQQLNPRKFEKHETFFLTRTYFDEMIDVTVKIWERSWALDTFTCNTAFLNKHYEKNGSFVIWASVLFCICLIVYSVASINTDKMRRAVLSVFVLCFAYTIVYRFVFYIRTVVLRGQTSRVTLCLWMIPELMLFIIGTWKQANVDKDNDEEEGTLDILLFKMRMLGYAFIITLPLFLFIVQLIALAILMYQSHVNGSLLYPFIGIICYLLLITYYFTIMVVSCAIVLSMDLDRKIPCMQDFLHARNIVVRYHFGTACYHATMIIPRIKIALIMYEEEFKEIPRFKSIVLMHWEVQHRSLMTTAVDGHDHSTYTRYVARCIKNYYTQKTAELKPIGNCPLIYAKLYAYCSIFLIAINSLLVIIFWVCDVTLDSNFAINTWNMYVSGMLVTYVMGGLFDLYVGARWYYPYQNSFVMSP